MRSRPTCVLISGQLDVAGQVLLASGLYAVWCFIDEYGRECFRRRVVPPLDCRRVGLGVGVSAGRALLLPMLEYSQTGARMARRSQGEEERPPVGLAALPQTVLPDMYGSTQDGSFSHASQKVEGNQLESSAATYTGLLATLLVAPLAWCSRRHRSINVFWVRPGVPRLELVSGRAGGRRSAAGAGTEHDVAQPLRLRHVVRHSRHDGRRAGRVVAGRRAVAAVVLGPIALLAMLLLWCVYRTVVLPETDRNPTRARRPAGATMCRGSPIWRRCDGSKRPSSARYAVAAVLCVLGIAGWLLLWLRVKWRPWLLPVLAALLLADLLWFAYGRSAQCDPALYYPRIPALESGEGGARPDHRIPLPAGDTRPDARSARHSRLRRRGPGPVDRLDGHRRGPASRRSCPMP